MKGRHVLLGGHTPGRDQKFTGVRLRLGHLEEWAGLGGSKHIFDADAASITFVHPEVFPALLANGGQVHLDQDMLLSSDTDSRQLNRVLWLRLEDLPAASRRELDRSVVTPLRTLLTLAVDADCPVMQIELATGDGCGWLSLYSSGLHPQA